MWLDCESNEQAMAWEMAKSVWNKTDYYQKPARYHDGPNKGAAALPLENDYLRILISMTVWAIWKSRNKELN